MTPCSSPLLRFDPKVHTSIDLFLDLQARAEVSPVLDLLWMPPLIFWFALPTIFSWPLISSSNDGLMLLSASALKLVLCFAR